MKKSKSKQMAVTQAEYERQVEPIVTAGLAPNKAAWLEVHGPADLSFPLDAKLSASIPDYLSGTVPKSRKELDANLEFFSESEYDLQIRPILDSGLMPNKAAWLETFATGSLSFPLDAELEMSLPEFLPGEPPESDAELYANLQRLKCT
jgi:hypothetical protein